MTLTILPAALATGPPRLHVNPPVRLSLRRCLPHRPLRSSIACGRRLPNPQHERLRGVEMSLTEQSDPCRVETAFDEVVEQARQHRHAPGNRPLSSSACGSTARSAGSNSPARGPASEVLSLVACLTFPAARLTPWSGPKRQSYRACQVRRPTRLSRVLSGLKTGGRNHENSWPVSVNIGGRFR
jgi:hypothetical protein